MKTLYFDCFAGASGDMILGALVAAGVEPHALIEQLRSLNVPGWKIDFDIVDRSGISSTYAQVRTAHEHAHRHLGDILKIIYSSDLNERVKDRAARIFSRLAEAESRVHNQPSRKFISMKSAPSMRLSTSAAPRLVLTCSGSNSLFRRLYELAAAWPKWPMAASRFRRPPSLNFSKASRFMQATLKVNLSRRRAPQSSRPWCDRFENIARR
jgi:hypothetical protein